MKEIKRYKLVATESSRNVIEASDGHWVRYADYYYVLNLLFNQCEENEEEASMKAHLLRNSVENNKRITKVSEENKQLQARIKELESNARINEIKAQGIGEAIKGFRTFAISNNVNLTCEDFDEYLCEQVNKLGAKDEKEI